MIKNMILADKIKLKELNISIAIFFLKYTKLIDDLIEYRCLCCNKNYQHKFAGKLWKCCNHDNNKFNLSLQKCVYPYEYMDDRKKFNQTSIAEKQDFYSFSNMVDITDADYVHAKGVCKDSEI